MPRNNHNGNTQRIRALLSASTPLRVDQIAEVLGMSKPQVISALNVMITRIGGAALAGRDGKFKLYTAPGRQQSGDARPLRGSGVIAPPPYRTGFRWFAGFPR